MQDAAIDRAGRAWLEGRWGWACLAQVLPQPGGRTCGDDEKLGDHILHLLAGKLRELAPFNGSTDPIGKNIVKTGCPGSSYARTHTHARTHLRDHTFVRTIRWFFVSSYLLPCEERGG